MSAGPILQFSGEHRFLSNFWMDGPFKVPQVGEGAQPCAKDVQASMSAGFELSGPGGDRQLLRVQLEVYDWRAT